MVAGAGLSRPAPFRFRRRLPSAAFAIILSDK
jgi:hypothetical protein